jgi:hypothetical protein
VKTKQKANKKQTKGREIKVKKNTKNHKKEEKAESAAMEPRTSSLPNKI